MKEGVLVILVLLMKSLQHAVFLLNAALDPSQILRDLSVILTL